MVCTWYNGTNCIYVCGAPVSTVANFPSSFPLIRCEGLSNLTRVKSGFVTSGRDNVSVQGLVAHFTARPTAITNKRRLCTNRTFLGSSLRDCDGGVPRPGQRQRSRRIRKNYTYIYIRSPRGKKDKPFGSAFVLTASI